MDAIKLSYLASIFRTLISSCNESICLCINHQVKETPINSIRAENGNPNFIQNFSIVFSLKKCAWDNFLDFQSTYKRLYQNQYILFEVLSMLFLLVFCGNCEPFLFPKFPKNCHVYIHVAKAKVLQSID